MSKFTTLTTATAQAKRRRPAGCVLVWLACAAMASAQTVPSANDVLAQVRTNVDAYMATLPDLFCEERYLSQRFNDGHQQETQTTVSTFRVRRLSGPPDPKHSRESRLVREVDGAPAHGDRIKGPYTLDGGFDRALELFTAARDCFTFALAPSADPAQIHLTFAAKPSLPASCPAADAGRTGEATLDAASKQVLALRQTMPHPQGGGDSWTPLRFTITFAPVSLGSRTFYTPQTIQTKLDRRGSSEYMQSIAQYSNYHKLEVTSTVLPTAPAEP